MRLFFIVLIIFSSLTHINGQGEHIWEKSDSLSIIIEVDGNPVQHKQYINKNFPTVDVVATYSLLFHGLALKGPVEKINKVIHSSFVKYTYPVQTYTTLTNNDFTLSSSKLRDNVYSPNTLNDTQFTGKGVKIGVIDTGIDYTHPDLQKNFTKGKDLIDLDEDPMETTEEQGLPTNHGTHVAGIIGANGSLKGVAPDVELYAYRALGPGGFGTTIQVLAALEEAVKDNVDIINLSLGNSVNGPDYPTSLAVNEVAKRGIAVIIANGNSGPNNWTVGAPATATNALSVGAYMKEREVPYLLHNKSDKKITLQQLPFAEQWTLRRHYDVTTDLTDVHGKIVLLPIDEKIDEQITKAATLYAEAILLYETERHLLDMFLQQNDKNYNIPIAIISKEDSKMLKKHLKETPLSVKSEFELQEEHVAPFSSRGPVTVNWQLKPDIIAPGVSILSTVPGGYDILSGTSMAAPHVAGAIALIKEAKPAWSNEQVFGALKTTALLLSDETSLLSPIVQGAGLIQIAKAIKTETIIYNPLLSFGKMNDHITTRTIDLTVENKTDKQQQYTFNIPKKVTGHTWNLPLSFTVQPESKKTVPVTLKVNTRQLEEGIYDGYLTLNRQHDKQKLTLPYMFINETADYPQVMGFTFHFNIVDEQNYTYQFYTPEQLKLLQVKLYDPYTLLDEGELLYLTDFNVGINEGTINRKKVNQRGHYHALIIAQLQNGHFVNYETELFLF